MKIALMGSAPSSRQLAPFNDHDWEIWSCSPPNYDLPRVDAWFELHDLNRKIAAVANRPYIETIMRHPRVYVAKLDTRFPNAIEYPWRRMVEKYGHDFFTSSLSWMMAYAIEQKPEKIGLWGVDMSAAEEYSQQRPGLKFFIREAEKLGIVIYAPPQSDILSPTPLYGIKEQSPMWAKQKARKLELEHRLNAAQQAIKKNEREALIFQGALDDMTYQNNTWCPVAYQEYIDGEDQA